MYEDLKEMAKFAQPGDESWTDAFLRYLKHLDRERARSSNPVQHMLRRLDVSTSPIPLVFRVDTFRGDGYATVKVYTKINGRKFHADYPVSEDAVRDYEAETLDMLRGMISRVMADAFAHSLRIRSREEVEEEDQNEPKSHIREW